MDSLSFEDATDLFWIMDNGPDNEEDEETLSRLLESYSEATGYVGEAVESDDDE